MTISWSMRLLMHISNRIMRDKTDTRLDSIRRSPLKLFFFFLIAEMMMFSVGFPSLLVCSLVTKVQPGLMLTDVLGEMLFIPGFLMELIADLQLSRFRHSRFSPLEKIYKRGLWQFSRHPNYFGNVMQQWGNFLICSSVITGWEWLLILCPIFTTLML